MRSVLTSFIDAPIPFCRTRLFEPQADGNGYSDFTISSDPVTLLKSMSIAHPVGTIILEALEVL